MRREVAGGKRPDGQHRTRIRRRPDPADIQVRPTKDPHQGGRISKRLNLSDSRVETEPSGAPVHPPKPTSITVYFADLREPRVERTRLHPLVNVLTIALLGVICRAEGWDDLAE